MVEERPAVRPSGPRAAFIEALQNAKAAEEARQKEWAEQAWHVVEEDMPFKRCADNLGIDARLLRDLNREHLKGLQLSSFLKKDTHLQIRPADAADAPAGGGASTVAEPPHLINRVVQIDGESDYEFWYVLTYLPDLQWCHVAPLERRGAFDSKPSPTGHKAEGRPCWMLVSEDQGGEIDVGAGRCHMMEAIEMKGTKANADKEEWDIIGRAPPGWTHPLLPSEEKAKAKAKRAAQLKEQSVGQKEAAKAVSKELSSCKAFVRQLMKHRDGEAFCVPVDWEALGLSDYPTIVTAPMDLGTVLRKLESGAYGESTPALGVAADVDQICLNSLPTLHHHGGDGSHDEP